MIQRIFLVLLFSLLVTGCAGPSRRPPAAVMIMPNDCGNRQAIANWLQDQSQIPRQTFETERAYEIDRAQIRQRLWQLRYNCQPV